MTWTTGYVEELDAGFGRFLIGTEGFSLTTPLEGDKACLFALLAKASQERHVVGVRRKGNSFELEFAFVGRPTRLDAGEGPLQWVKFRGCSRPFQVGQSQEKERQILEKAMQADPCHSVRMIVGRTLCSFEQCELHMCEDLPLRQEPPTRLDVQPVEDEKTAEEIFAALQAHHWDRNDPCTKCIPFDFPDFGCEAKAHKGWAVLQPYQKHLFKLHSVRAKPGAVCTANHPQGRVCWTNHMALAIRLKGANGALEDVVLDPSLFSRKERRAQWEKRVWNGGGGKTAEVSATVLFPADDGRWYVDDEELSWTNRDLSFQRLSLRNRAQCQGTGWPPYPDIRCD